MTMQYLNGVEHGVHGTFILQHHKVRAFAWQRFHQLFQLA